MDNYGYSAHYKRIIPFGLKFRIWFGKIMSRIGVITFLFILPFTIVFVPYEDVFSASFDDNDPVAVGIITETMETNATVGEEMVYGYNYQYELPDGSIYYGTGYSTGNTKNNGDEVDILYKHEYPEKSKAVDLRNSKFGKEIGIFILVLQGIGLLILILSILKVRPQIHILKVGVLASGKLLNREATNVKINNQTVYEMTFEFTASDHKTYKTVVRSFQDERLRDEPYEKLVYDPRNPEKAVLLDQLPAGIKDLFLNMNLDSMN